MSYAVSQINVEVCLFFFKRDLIVLFFLLCLVNITVFRVPCIPITPISIDTFLKVLELLPLESLSAILEYRFALQQQQNSKKMCHFMFSVEKIVYVTCMLDNNSLIHRVLYNCVALQIIVFNQNNKYCFIL